VLKTNKNSCYLNHEFFQSAKQQFPKFTMLTINYPNHTYLLPNFLIEIKLDLKVNKLSLAPRQFP
jgi:hypothetical protein